MNIGIDLDCVLADFQTALIAFHNESFKTTLQLDDFWTFKYHDIWGGTPEQGLAKMEEFYGTPHFASIMPMPGALTAIKTLARKHQLFIVTARLPNVEGITHDWVKKYFPDLISGIYFASNNYTEVEGRRRKADYCLSLNLDILVEDDIGYAKECLSEKTKIILMDQPWNRKFEPPAGITRAKSWPEILSIIEAN